MRSKTEILSTFNKVKKELDQARVERVKYVKLLASHKADDAQHLADAAAKVEFLTVRFYVLAWVLDLQTVESAILAKFNETKECLRVTEHGQLSEFYHAPIKDGASDAFIAKEYETLLARLCTLAWVLQLEIEENL